MPETLVGVGFAALAAVAITVQSLAVRLASGRRSVAEIAAVIFALNLLVLVPVAAVAEYPHYGVTPAALAAFATAGLLGSLVARLCYFVGIARIGASRTEPLKALFPVVAVAGAVLVLGESVTAHLLAGLALVLAGTTAVVLEARDSPVTPTGRRLRTDVLFPLAAAFFLGVDPVFTKLGLAEGTPAVVGVTLRVAAGAAGFALYVTVRGDRDTVWPTGGLDRWLVTAGLANTAYLLAYYAALARTPVAVVTPVLGTSTLLVVAAAAVFLQDDERVTWTLGAATLVVVLGIALIVAA